MDCGDIWQVVEKPFEAIGGAASLEPQTPVAYRVTPTMSLASDSPLSEPETTPTGFAPSPDAVALSSLCHHYTDKMRISPVDSRSSDSSNEAGLLGSQTGGPDSISDEEILESIYQNLLEAIVSLQIDGNLTDFWSFDGCKTPLSVHCSPHLPDTCPGAPMKLTRISRNIDSGLRRKLF